MLALAVVMLVAAGVVAAVYLFRQHEHGTPYDADKPATSVVRLTRMAKTAGGPRACRTSDGLPTPSVGRLAPRVWVDSDPIGAVVLWHPSTAVDKMPARMCRAELTRLDRKRATAFARAVEKAPLPADAVVSCAHAGPVATVFLSYRGRKQAEVVRVVPSCPGSLSAPGRAPRQVGDALKPLGRAPAAAASP